MRLDSKTPAKIALYKLADPQKNKIGRPKQTWLATIKADLKDQIESKNKDNMHFISELEGLASDRRVWNEVVKSVCETSARTEIRSDDDDG